MIPNPQLLNDADRYTRKLAEALVKQQAACQARFDAEWALFHAKDVEQLADETVARLRREVLRIIDLAAKEQ